MISVLPVVSPHLSQMVHLALHREVIRELGVSSVEGVDRAQTIWALGRGEVDEAVRRVLQRPDAQDVIWRLSPLPLEGSDTYREMGDEAVRGYLEELTEAFCKQMAGSIWLASSEVAMASAAGGPDYTSSQSREEAISSWLDRMKASGPLVPDWVDLQVPL